MSNWKSTATNTTLVGPYHQPASAGATTTESSGPRAKCDQVVYEAIAKACELIVCGRGGGIGAGAVGAGGNSYSNNHSANSSSSSRFNLQIPEIHSVRSILHVYRLALHVPIRLDVYYQHAEGDRRELLERWCLEYRPAPMERFLQAEGILTQDPIAQLRHVCKRIVIWLRTLYCWTRLLPAQAFPNSTMNVSTASGGVTGWAGGGPGLRGHYPNIPGNSHHNHLPIGFSIYVNAEGKDDISDLTTNQGFHWQGQPTPVVTPYGELGWKVIYCPASTIERLLPPVPRPPIQQPFHVGGAVNRTQSASRPIPVQNFDQEGNEKGLHLPAGHYHKNNTNHHGIPQSAPAQFAEKWSPQVHLSNGGTNSNMNKNHHTEPAESNGNNTTQNTYDSSHLYYRRVEQEQHQNQMFLHPSGHGVPLQRRHTSIGQERSSHSDDEDYEKSPERVMSGLSLALMMVDNESSSTRKQRHDDNLDPQDGGKSTADSTTPTTTGTDRRRAALHEVPAYVREHQQLQLQQPTPYHQHQSSKQPTTQGEYGYGYNNHIPWKKIQPSNTNPTLFRSPSDVQDGARWLGTSPSAFLASTPPSGAFLGGGGAAAVTPSGLTMGGAPRPPQMSPFLTSSSTVGPVPPPFQSRPAGFVQEAPQCDVVTRPLPHSTKQLPEDGPVADSRGRAGPATMPPLTSMDLLHSSPFQQPSSHGSMLLSLTIGAGTGYGGSATSVSGMATSHSVDLVQSLWNASSSAINPAISPRHLLHPHHPYYNDEDNDDEMPFVVDDNAMEDPTAAGRAVATLGGAALSNHHNTQTLGSISTSLTSSAVASLAQRCSHSTRLKIFERSTMLSSQSTPLPGSVASSSITPNALLLDESISGLTGQLADFRSFGASLRGTGTTSISSTTSHNMVGGGISAPFGGTSGATIMTTTAGGTNEIASSSPISQPLPPRASTPITLRP